MIPFVPHDVYVLKVVRPRFVLPRAIGATEGSAESFITDLAFSFRRNSIVCLRILTDWELYKKTRTTRRNFVGKLYGYPAADRHFDGLFNGHGLSIA